MPVPVFIILKGGFMLVKFYKHNDLKYARRKRMRTFDYEPFATSEYCTILFNDGAEAQIKVSKDKLCDYVVIGDTRWFYTSHTWLNGEQITMYLQRDVIGERGLTGMFGQIERGYTNSVLRNRKELNVNEILKDRKKIIPNTNTYGNFSVDNHNNEMWGVLYFVKPTGLDPTTGKPYPEQVNVNIPAFAPQTVDYELIPDNTTVVLETVPDVRYKFNVNVKSTVGTSGLVQGIYGYTCESIYTPEYNTDGTISNWVFSYQIRPTTVHTTDYFDFEISIAVMQNSENTNKYNIEFIGELLKFFNTKNSGFIEFPDATVYTKLNNDYSNVIIKNETDFYQYTAIDNNAYNTGKTQVDAARKYFTEMIGTTFPIGGYSVVLRNVSYANALAGYGYYFNTIRYGIRTYYRRLLTASESGNIVIDTTQQLVDEPYSVLVFPLFDVNITGKNNYNIKRSEAFMIFNTVIQYLSGENPYLVDAQIYPYCPVLTTVQVQINNYPFFRIAGNTFNHTCRVNLLPSSDIKKEYIQRKYSIKSPEQSGSFDFNFYDYKTEIIDENGINMAELTVVIKTALKPFSIISCCVIQPDANSIIGSTYSSDLRGSSPTANGFECSLSSNAFETYKRQNSNYQQTFSLQKEELALQHATERVNERTQQVVNTITATTFGAIGGKAVGGVGLAGNIGAGIGAVGAAATVGIAGEIQYRQNEKLREFEENLQQQNFDLQIGTIKALPNTINRISSFNEILMQDFWFIIEIYECSDYEKILIDDFISLYGYGLGVHGLIENFVSNGWFLRSTLISSFLEPNLHNVASNELKGGIYYYE